MYRFDETTLKAEISMLPHAFRVAFAAACAERQMDAYKEFEEECSRPRANALVLALEETWMQPDQPQDLESFECRLDALMRLVPNEDNIDGAWTQGATNAQNAGMTVIYALRARLRGDARESAWAARVAYEALDNFVINTVGIDINIAGAELDVAGHPLVQAELLRQLRDLADLKSHASEPLPTAIAGVRARAIADSSRFYRP